MCMCNFEKNLTKLGEKNAGGSDSLVGESATRCFKSAVSVQDDKNNKLCYKRTPFRHYSNGVFVLTPSNTPFE